MNEARTNQLKASAPASALASTLASGLDSPSLAGVSQVYAGFIGSLTYGILAEGHSQRICRRPSAALTWRASNVCSIKLELERTISSSNLEIEANCQGSQCLICWQNRYALYSAKFIRWADGMNGVDRSKRSNGSNSYSFLPLHVTLAVKVVLLLYLVTIVVLSCTNFVHLDSILNIAVCPILFTAGIANITAMDRATIS